MKEIEVQATKTDKFRFFSLLNTDSGVVGNPADSYLGIQPNAIERHYAELYDRGIEKQMASAEALHES